jgi:pseudaminic acid synthase
MFTSKNIRVIRPGDGLHPKYYDMILGKIAKTDISRGTPTKLSFF